MFGCKESCGENICEDRKSWPRSFTANNGFLGIDLYFLMYFASQQKINYPYKHTAVLEEQAVKILLRQPTFENFRKLYARSCICYIHHKQTFSYLC